MQGNLTLSEPTTTCETTLSHGRVALHFRGERREMRGKNGTRGRETERGDKEGRRDRRGEV